MLTTTNLRYLYFSDKIKYDPVLTKDFDYQALPDMISSYHEQESFKAEFSNAVKVQHITSELRKGIINQNEKAVWTRETINAVVYHLGDLIARKFLEGNTKNNSSKIDEISLQNDSENFGSIVEGAIFELCDVDDTGDDRLDVICNELEIQSLYVCENIFADLVEREQNYIIKHVLQIFWDGLVVSKSTVLEKWSDDKYFSDECGRGLNKKDREDMKIAANSFIDTVKNSDDDEDGEASS